MNKTRLQISAVMTVAALSGFASAAYGFAEFDGGPVLLQTTARATYDSYFIGSHDPKAGDEYISVHPNLTYSHQGGLTELNAFLGVDILRYDKNSSFNTENVSAGATLKLPDIGSRLSGSFSLSYIESDNVDFNVVDRYKQKVASALLDLNYKLSLKMSLSEDFSFSHTDRDNFSDQTLFHNSLSYRYNDFLEGTSLRLTEDFNRTKSNGINMNNADLNETSNSISAGLTRHLVGPVFAEVAGGYRFLHRDTQGQGDLNGAFYNLNLHGPFLPPRLFPNIESSASISYEQSQNPGINDTGQRTITGDIHVAWQFRPPTKVSFDLNRSVELTATDMSVNNTNVNLGLTEKIGYQTDANASIGYTWRTYPHNAYKDDTLEINFGLTHHYNKYLSAGVSYQYQDNNSNGAPAAGIIINGNPHDFSRHLVSLFVTTEF